MAIHGESTKAKTGFHDPAGGFACNTLENFEGLRMAEGPIRSGTMISYQG